MKMEEIMKQAHFLMFVLYVNKQREMLKCMYYFLFLMCHVDPWYSDKAVTLMQYTGELFKSRKVCSSLWGIPLFSRNSSVGKSKLVINTGSNYRDFFLLKSFVDNSEMK